MHPLKTLVVGETVRVQAEQAPPEAEGGGPDALNTAIEKVSDALTTFNELNSTVFSSTDKDVEHLANDITENLKALLDKLSDGVETTTAQ